MAGRTSRGLGGRRRGSVATAGVLCGALASLIAPTTAVALSRTQADGLALRALAPRHARGGLGVVVYGMPSALPARDSVDVFRARRSQALNRHALGHRVWMFWEDLAPGAMFSHTSVLLLVDDASGRVQRRTLEWWPLINGRPPPFLTGTKPPARRYVVFSSVRARAKAASHASGTATDAAGGGRLAWPAQSPLQSSAHTAQAHQITPQNLAHDCLITVGLETANLAVRHGGQIDNVRPLTSDFAAIRGWAGSVGLNTYDGGDSAGSLDAAVTAAIEQHGCTDVFIFLAGHGTPPPGKHKQGLETVQSPGGPAGVLTRAQYVPPADGGNEGGGADTQLITPADLANIMAKHNASRPLAERATFKIKIDACFAGRFVPELRTASNLEFLEVSSAANETSFFHLADGADVRRGGRIVHVANDTANPQDVTEFMNRDLHGLETWASSPQAHDEPSLASGLAASFLIGEDFDFAATIGYTTPQEIYTPEAVTTTFPPPPPPPPPPVPETFGSDLSQPSADFGKATADFVLWLLDSAGAARAHTAALAAASAPAAGQITQVTVRGRFAGHCPVTPETVCQEGMHFQDLRPQPDGSVKVISTSQAFKLPTIAGTYSFAPTNMFVAQGDFIGLATPGGEWEVLVSAPGITTDMFEGHEKDNNGAQFTPTSTITGEELNIQMTLLPGA